MIYWTVLAVWNAVVALIYGIDKFKAKRNSRRISEACLLILALLMGALGALTGMYLFRHKTKKLKFQIIVPLLLVINIAATWGICQIF